ncbi:YybS family protein [Lederbergia panacisoli]|uniref:YybS family protein n=1 Tax=Lederbergia panacisoli TaxID=1255251 RepID=UPI00214AA5A6|nr:YybS family protein [Lederbergia panacisoli]MCR2822676.1 YybS family protein [Lederbergia panacisoli]
MKDTRTLTEGAAMLALYTIMLLVAIFIPFSSIVLHLFFILPFLIYSAKYSVKYSIILIISAMIISFIIGSFVAMPIAFLFGTTGLMMGYGIRVKESKQIIYISSSIVFIANIILFFIAAALFFNINFMDELKTMFQTSIDQYMAALHMVGMTPPVEFQEQLNEMANLMITMLPTLLVGTAFISVIIIMVVNFPILKRLGIDVPKFQPFRRLKFPKNILWLYLLVLVLSIIFKFESDSYLQMAVVNAGLILQTLLVIQGLSFIFFYCHLKKWAIVIPILAVIFTLLMPVILSIVRVLGIIDLGFDLRQRIKQK